MHHCDNLNPTIMDAVNDPKGESGDATFAPILADQTIHIRMGSNPMDGFRNGFKETPAKTCLLRFVINNRF